MEGWESRKVRRTFLSENAEKVVKGGINGGGVLGKFEGLNHGGGLGRTDSE